MLKETQDNLDNILSGFIGKTIIIEQSGFIESVYTINNIQYLIKHDMLNIMNQNSREYIKINLNQVYQTTINKDEIIFYLDNDLKIKLQIKR